ncbi:MAG: RagB/SusD family nutrient uptake outer membrane protein [Bacteroidota bacterium]
MKRTLNKYLIFSFLLVFGMSSCEKNFLQVTGSGTTLETDFYKTQEEFFQALVATYDPLQWGGTDGWTMLLGLANAASDDTHAGGSDASDQPSWVAWDMFTLNPDLGPQSGLWKKNYAGIYRANLLLEKLAEQDFLESDFVNRTMAEAKFLRAYYYFDLVRLFGNVPLITSTLGADEFSTQMQVPPSEIYAQVESDLRDAINTIELPTTLPPDEFGRVTQGAAKSLLGKAILYQNNEGRMLEAAAIFEEVINSGVYFLEPNFGDIFKTSNEFGPESIWEIQYSDNRPGDWGCCFASGPTNQQTEGNYNIQFFGMRDYVGPTYATGWSFCPVSENLATAMQSDPRFQHTIIDGNALQQQGASYSPGYQNTDYFIRKYAPIADEAATDGVLELAWKNNIRDIRLADVMLMAAEALVRGGGDEGAARGYVNAIRLRAGTIPISGSGQDLLDRIYLERRFELATEGHRFFDLVRTGRAAEVLGDRGYVEGVHNVLPIPQTEIDLSGSLLQNPGY